MPTPPCYAYTSIAISGCQCPKRRIRQLGVKERRYSVVMTTWRLSLMATGAGFASSAAAVTPGASKDATGRPSVGSWVAYGLGTENLTPQ